MKTNMLTFVVTSLLFLFKEFLRFVSKRMQRQQSYSKLKVTPIQKMLAMLKEMNNRTERMEENHAKQIMEIKKLNEDLKGH